MTIDELAARAAAHQRVLDRGTVFLKPKDLVHRWGCSRGTIAAIPFAALPWQGIGQGAQREHRRYHPDDVLAYEATGALDLMRKAS